MELRRVKMLESGERNGKLTDVLIALEYCGKDGENYQEVTYIVSKDKVEQF